MNPKYLLKLAAVILFCALVNSCSSDLDFDQINDFSAEPEIAANLAYFELPIPSSIPSLPLFTFPPVNAKFDILRDASVSKRLSEATLFFEVENINVKQYEVVVEFKDVNDRVLDRIAITEAEAKYDDVSKKLSKSVTYKSSQLDILKLATSIDFTASIVRVTPLTIANDTLKFRSSAIIKLALQ
jgi:hypothetical protein